MSDIYSEEELTKLEEEEHSVTEEALLLMLLLLMTFKDELVRELRAFFQQYGQDGVVTYAEARRYVSNNDHRRRLAVLLLLIHNSFNKLGSNLRKPFGDMIQDVINKEQEFFGVELADDFPLTWGADDKDWEDRLTDDVHAWEVALALAIKVGIAQQKPIDDIVADIDKKVTTMQGVLTALAISETTAVGSLARHLAFKALGVDRYRFFSRPDERRCDVCGEMHGRVFPVSVYEPGVTASPMHPRCRCWEVPLRG